MNEKNDNENDKKTKVEKLSKAQINKSFSSERAEIVRFIFAWEKKLINNFRVKRIIGWSDWRFT